MAVEASEYLKARQSSAEAAPPRALIPYPYAHPDDEIDLVEVGVSLWRRWKLMLAVFLVCVGIGLALAFLHERDYQYSAVMQLGTVSLLGDGHTVISPQSAAARLQQVYIPDGLGKAEAGGMTMARNLEIDVNVEKGSQAVALAVKTPQRNGPAISRLLEGIVAAASAGINSRIAAYVSRNRAYLKQEIANIGKRDNALQAQAAQLSRGGAAGAAAGGYVATETAALAQQEAQLRQQLDVQIPTNVERAGLVGGVARSARPVGLGRGVIAALAAVVAVILALLAAALANYGAAVRRRLAGPQSGPASVAEVVGRVRRHA